MKKNNNRKTKLTLLILILCVTLGYAALRTGLNINGIATIPSVSWDVYFANYQNSASTNITPTTEPSTPAGTKPTTVSYAVTLAEPGDLYEFTIDIVNDGTIDANINLVSKLDDVEISQENPLPDYLTYTITDQNDQPIQTDHRLNHGVTETYKIKLLFKEDVDPEDLPGNGATLNLDIELTATQAEKLPPEETGVFTVNTNGNPYSHQGPWLVVGQTMSNEFTTYSTPSAAMAAFNNRPYYLKIVLNENTNVVEEAYVGFVITDALKNKLKNERCSGDVACETAIDNLVNGTYYLKGETNDLLNNVSVIKTAFNYALQPEICEAVEDYAFHCSVSGLTASGDEYGYVFAYDENNSGCNVFGEGTSWCWEN